MLKSPPSLAKFSPCRFLATLESFAHPYYKQKLLEYDKTEYTNIFGRSRWPDAPHRVLETPFFNDWRHLPDHENEQNQPVIGHSTIHGVVSHFLTTGQLVYTSLVPCDKDMIRI